MYLKIKKIKEQFWLPSNPSNPSHPSHPSNPSQLASTPSVMNCAARRFSPNYERIPDFQKFFFRKILFWKNIRFSKKNQKSKKKSGGINFFLNKIEIFWIKSEKSGGIQKYKGIPQYFNCAEFIYAETLK